MEFSGRLAGATAGPMNGKTLHARELRIIVKLQDWITAKMTAATWECDRTKILYWHRKPPPGVSPYRILKSRVTCGLHASKTFVLLYEVYGGPRRPLTFVGLRGPPSLQNHLFYCIKRTEAHGGFSHSWASVGLQAFRTICFIA